MKIKAYTKITLYLCGLVFFTMLGGCATSNQPHDPYEGWNRGVYTFNDNLDEYALKPVAQGYQWITPSFVDTGITNFFNNIGDIRVTLNDLLQFKMAQGGMDATRFLINSTIGVAGLFDVATGWDFPKHNEDFGQTLGVWGVPMGPYLVLPLLGPSSPRGAVGLVGDTLMNPITYIDEPFISLGLFALKTVDTRADLLGASKIAKEADPFGDEYSFIRDSYIQKREDLVEDVEVPTLDDEETEFEEELVE